MNLSSSCFDKDFLLPGRQKADRSRELQPFFGSGIFAHVHNFQLAVGACEKDFEYLKSSYCMP